MYGISIFFLGTLFYGFIGPDAVDLVKMPLGLNLEVSSSHGVGTVVLVDGIRMLEVTLWRSYLAGCILLGIAPCTAMVLVWGFLSKGNDGHTLVMVAINSLAMLFLFGPLGGFLLGVGRLPVPWEGHHMALPLISAIYPPFAPPIFYSDTISISTTRLQKSLLSHYLVTKSQNICLFLTCFHWCYFGY